MKIKHSKFKNTGLIYELLVKQITSDLVSRKDSPAVSILRKYYSGNTVLVQEYGLYKALLDSKNTTSFRANALIDASLRASQALDLKALSAQKYNLVSEIKENYNLEDFFSIPIKDYKALAACYCLFEASRSNFAVDPRSVVTNKVTLLEHMTSYGVVSEEDPVLKEYSTYDKDLRLLTFKLLLEKYNEKYKGLLDEQKEVLKSVISLESVRELREYVNQKHKELSTKLTEIKERVPEGIERIKLNEAIKLLDPLTNTEKVTNVHLVRLLQFYDLVNELKEVV